MLVTILGSAQDGGVPQVGMRPGIGPWRTASSIAVASGESFFLFDASPDLRMQQRSLLEESGYAERAGDAFDGIFLTHGHMGHYSGLVHFGKEAHAPHGIPLYGTESMLGFLQSNEPWASLIGGGYLAPVPVEPATPVTVRDLTVTAVTVPHRAEHTDTVAWSISRGWSILYLPDIDAWEQWPQAEETLEAHDVCLIDATFFAADELGEGRERSIPHPTVRNTVDRWGHLASTRRLILTHINSTNPIADPGSSEAMWTKDSGFEIARDGMLLSG